MIWTIFFGDFTASQSKDKLSNLLSKVSPESVSYFALTIKIELLIKEMCIKYIVV